MTPWNQREAGLDPPASADPGEPPSAEAPQEAGGRGRRAGVVWPWLVVCCYLAGAVAVTARLWVDPAGRAQAGDANDVDLFAWFVRYAATAVGHGQLPALVTSAMNAPQGVNLMWNTSFLLPGVLLAPLTLLAGPQVSLTVVLTAGFAGSAASLFWVLRRWGAGLGAAALGGAVYGFSPALVASGAGHYHLQFAVLPPLIIDAALRLLTGRSRAVRGGVWLGLLCAAQLFTGEELLVYTVVAAVILAATVAVSHPRAVPARTRGAASGLAVAVLVFLLVDGYALWVQFAGPLTEHSKLGGSLTGNLSWFVTPAAALWFHTTASAAEAASQQLAAEYVSYLGWPLIGMLVVCAVVFWRDVRVRAAAVTCAVLELCALGGGSLRVDGGVTWPGRLLPWHWLQGLPGLAQVLPWRFSILADGAAAAVLAFALDRAWTAVSRARDGGGQPDWPGWAGWWPRAAFTVAPVPRAPAGWDATFSRLRLPADAPVLIVPYPSLRQVQVLRWQAETGQPRAMIGGYFIGPDAKGQAAFPWAIEGPQTAFAGYLSALSQGLHPPSPSGAEVRAAMAFWRPSAVVAVTGPQSPVARALTRLFGRPALHIGEVLSWQLRR